MDFSSWTVIQEAKKVLLEAERVTSTNKLDKYVREKGDLATFEEASVLIEGLTEEIFKAAKDVFEVTKNLYTDDEETEKEEKEQDADDAEEMEDEELDTKAKEDEDKEEAEEEEEDEEEDKEEEKADKKAEKNESVSLEEGKMKEIFTLGQESSSKEEFETKLKDYLRKSGKADLANDKDFIAGYVDQWEPSEEEK